MAETAPITLKTDGDKLKFRSLSASEEMARLFEFNVLAVSEPDAVIDLKALLGTKASVALELPTGGPRQLHGIVASAGFDGIVGRRPSYRLTLRPWLWMLTRRSDTRIFQNKTIEQILRDVFSVYAADFEFDITARPQYEYCVQYRETDFNFVSRLMEEEGMYYFFTHTASQHKMVICDKMGKHAAFPGFAKVKFRDTHDASLDFQAVEQWRSQFELPSSKYSHDDYNFLTSQQDLIVSETSGRTPQRAALEIYDPPGRYAVTGQGKRLAKIRMEEIDARFHRVSGSSFSVRGIAVGHRMRLEEHPRAAENDEYVILTTRIEAQYAGYEAGTGPTHFECRFTALRAGETFRPDRITPKPIVPGPQTAEVVGPAGDEIHTDVHGRVKVQFHWDRLGKKDPQSSCFLRVASGWAGKAWGMISLPRIGQEVVVSFIEGDPDRPLITGRVYNDQQITPYLLPDNKTVSTIKSRSTLSGVAANFNELAFEDKIGEEFIRLHAEKDLVEIVKHDAHLRVDHDQFRIVKGNVTEKVDGSMHLTVGGNVTQHLGGKVDLKIAKEVKAELEKKLDVLIKEEVAVEAKSSLALTVGGGADVKIGTELNVEAGTNIHIKSGANLIIESGTQITLKGAMVHIEASGICSIKGSMVHINTGGAPGTGPGAKPKAPEEPVAPAQPQPLIDRVKEIDDQLKKGR
jgi:type VI secretion system secreted protein VgrG